MAGNSLTMRVNATPPYPPLNPERHEVRLVEFVAPGTFGVDTEHGVDLACAVNAYSLDDYNNAYVQFEGQTPSTWTTIEKIHEWKASRQACSISQMVHSYDTPILNGSGR